MSSRTTRTVGEDRQSFAEVSESDVNSVEVETTAKGHRATIKLYYPSRGELLACADTELAIILRALHRRFPDLEGAVPQLDLESGDDDRAAVAVSATTVEQ